MALKVAAKPESFERGGGNYLKEPGTYHFAVKETNEQPSDKGGKLIDGFQVSVMVLAGTTSGQEKKEIDLVFWNPKLTDKQEQQDRDVAKQNRFLEAIGLLDRHKPAEEVELSDGVGRQFIATMEWRQKKNDATGKYEDDKSGIRIHFADTFHVDDPDAAAFPKHQEALKLLPKELRRDASYYPAKTSGNGQANGSNGNSKPAVDLDTL